MAETHKVLGQSNPSATTATTLYTVPGGTQAIISTLVVANRSGTPTTFRVAIRPGGATLDNAHYVAFDAPIGANEIWSFTCGFTLAATDVVTVYAGAATLTFSAYGVEIS